MSKHTPGPWIFWEDKNGRLQVGASFNYTIAAMYSTPLEEQGANARLIAAAPDMRFALEEALSALLDYVERLEKRGDVMGYGHSVIRKVYAAIAKAEGQS